MFRLILTLFTPHPALNPSDPLAHPALRRMTPRELADLPLPRPAR